ncbi:hypothetical protein CRG98_016520 [Punica granatum]|uniref:Uncharacterized protein n=1 Tax=Punica granatum TaxID=22663 RepID=A0A2I0K3E0_PUNGR|nr:hypothetical protein CRG98_016520 [Punica granatum]
MKKTREWAVWARMGRLGLTRGPYKSFRGNAWLTWFADVLSDQSPDKLVSQNRMLTVSITKENFIEPLEIEIAKGPAHCDANEATDEQPWYEDIKHFLQTGQYLAFANRRDRKIL